MTSIIDSVAYARLSAPDLDKMQKFLEDFGLIFAHRDADRLYMRGLCDEPFIHVTELGEPGHIGFGYNAVGEQVLHDLVSAGKADRVEDIDEPGGGKRVRLVDPNGFEVDLVYGREKVEELPTRPKLRTADAASTVWRPSGLRRMVHCAIATPLLNETIDWWRDTLGLLPTDELYIDNPDNRLGLFLRIDKGPEMVHHHILFVVKNPNAGVHHVSFEVDDIEDLFMGHDYLKATGNHAHMRGIGHHPLGRQFFDYWLTPWNQMHEHWSTSELMNDKSAFNKHQVNSSMTHGHQEQLPKAFVTQSSPVVKRAALAS